MIPPALVARVLSVLFATGAVHAGGPDPYTPDPRVDAQHYVFRLELTDTDDVIHGHSSAEIRVLDDGVDVIKLDLVGQSGSKGMRIQSVRIDGKFVRFEHAKDVVAIPVPDAKKGTYYIDVDYSGVPGDGLIIDSNRHGDRTFFGDNWPNRARHWLPVIDHPSDKATVEYIVTAPSHYQVVASGRLLERTDIEGNRRVTHTKTSVPLATKVMVIGIAQFAIQHVGDVAGVPVESWIYPQDRENGFRGYRPAKEILEYFVGRLGAFPYQKLANVQSKTRYGGMENAGNIFYSEGSVSERGTSESLLAHEIAHQWFGDSVSERDWYHVWLSEGFATYLSSLHAEFAHGREQLVSTLAVQRTSIVNYHKRNPDSPVIDTSITNLNNLLSTNSYQKGGWFLHMLRAEVGDDQFWQILREYYSRFRDGNAVTSDFRRVADDVTGRDLQAFFDQWLRRPGQPAVEVVWQYNRSSDEMNVTVKQTQESEPFAFVLELGVTGADGEMTIHAVEVQSRSTTTSFALAAAPKSVVADPNVNLLATFDVTQK